MPIPDIFPNLPGFVAQINETGLKVPTPSQTLSQSVLLLGVATDGPGLTPISIASLADGERIFGVTTAIASITGTPIIAKSLTRGMYEAFAAGCTDIRLCRVGGTQATATIADSASANQITLTAGYAGSKYNPLTVSSIAPVASAAGSVTITTLDAVAHVFPVTTTTLYGDLVNAINSSNINILASQPFAGNPLAAASTITTSTATAFTGGVDGTNLTDAQYSDALTAAYRLLENYNADIIVPLGAYLQPTMALDASGNATIANTALGDTVYFGQNLAQFCARVSVRNSSAIGIISVSPLLVPTTLNVSRWITQIQGTSYLFQYAGDYSPSAGPKSAPATGVDGKVADTGFLLQVIAAPQVVVNNPSMGTYAVDGAATYAGKICTLPPQSATTNKPIASIYGLTFQLGASVQDSFTGARFVTFGQSAGAIRTIADQTYSLPGLDFTKLSTLRIAYSAMNRVRNATQAFIGEANNPALLNSMGTTIDQQLVAMKIEGALLDYDWAIKASPSDQIAGNINVVLGLVPALQIRKIYVTINLKPAQA